ncbi:MAG: Helicase associated domain protein [Bacteroidaceae bacterium]
MGKNEENWLEKYAGLKDYISLHRHLPNKKKEECRGLLNWWKYNKKLIKQGKQKPERMRMLMELDAMRDLPARPDSQSLWKEGAQ